MAMTRLTLNAPEAPLPAGGYAQAVEARGAARVLYISGQIPVSLNGAVPETFEEQCRLVWSHVRAQLAAANMGFSDLVKVTTFLGDRRHAEENGRIRRDVLGTNAPALTVIIASIYDPAWLLEIEAIAAA